MTEPPLRPLVGPGPQLGAMSGPSSAGAGGLGAAKAGGGKHGAASAAAAAAAAAAVAAAAGVGSVAGSGSAASSAVLSLPAAGLPGQPTELTALFECPVCFDYVLPPILQCQSGHLVCNPCRQKLSCCPTCRGPLSPSIRNLAMEKVASTLPFPCKVSPPAGRPVSPRQHEPRVWIRGGSAGSEPASSFSPGELSETQTVDRMTRM